MNVSHFTAQTARGQEKRFLEAPFLLGAFSSASLENPPASSLTPPLNVSYHRRPVLTVAVWGSHLLPRASSAQHARLHRFHTSGIERLTTRPVWETDAAPSHASCWEGFRRFPFKIIEVH